MDVKKFANTKFSDRTEEYPAPDLAPFCKAGEKPVLVLRGLTAEESMICNESAARTEKVMKVAEGLFGNNPDALKSIAELIGVTAKESPAEYGRRLSILELGSVSPKFDRSAAIHLAKNYPATFLEVTTRILALTGLGRIPGKLKGSGKTRVSATP